MAPLIMLLIGSILKMQLILNFLRPFQMKWPPKTTIVNGKYVEEVVIWRVEKLPVTVILGASNDND